MLDEDDLDPFPPGTRLRLGGGYDPRPDWLCGKLWHEGTLERFIPGQNSEPAAVVRLDEPISVEGFRGSVVVLELRYAGARWGQTETVHVELCDFDPESRPWQERRQGKWVESHATYEKVDPEDAA